MVGEGSRFTKAGYNLPKFKIEVNNKSLFFWSLISLEKYFSNENKFIFICQKKHSAVDFINTECKKLGITNFEVIELESLTKGQAETVLFAENLVDINNPILIYNIDTHVNPISLPIINKKDIDGFIPCFLAYDDKWSFVKTNTDLIAQEVREKQIISNNATIGLYWFSSFQLYKQAYLNYYSESKNIEKNELYIAPIYNQLIKENKIVKICLIDKINIINLGTPEDVEIAKSTLRT